MDDDDTTEPQPNLKLLWFALAGVIASGAIMVIVQRITKPAPSPILEQSMVEGDWQTSMQHLAAAFQARCDGLEARINDIVAERVAGAAATSVPAPTIDPTIGAMPATPRVGLSENDVAPPATPAAVSM